MNNIISVTLQGELLNTQIASSIAGNVADIFARSATSSCKIAEFIHAFELSVSESFANSVLYADDSDEEQLVQINFSFHKQELTTTVIDSNQQFNPHPNPPDISSYPEEGYGLFIISTFMDTVSYSRNEGQNILVMSKHVGSA